MNITLKQSIEEELQIELNNMEKLSKQLKEINDQNKFIETEDGVLNNIEIENHLIDNECIIESIQFCQERINEIINKITGN